MGSDKVDDMLPGRNEYRAMRERIQATIEPSDYFPKPGDVFRVRFATVADRSYMGDLWRCVGTQNQAVLARRVFSEYGGVVMPNGTPSILGGPLEKVFILGDFLFYDASALWQIYEQEQATTKAVQKE